MYNLVLYNIVLALLSKLRTIHIQRLSQQLIKNVNIFLMFLDWNFFIYFIILIYLTFQGAI